jgi:hypothetical protein
VSHPPLRVSHQRDRKDIKGMSRDSVRGCRRAIQCSRAGRVAGVLVHRRLGSHLLCRPTEQDLWQPGRHRDEMIFEQGGSPRRRLKLASTGEEMTRN